MKYLYKPFGFDFGSGWKLGPSPPVIELTRLRHEEVNRKGFWPKNRFES